jgi:hypothetical protein
MIAEEIGDDVRHVEVELPTQIFYRVHKLSGYTYITWTRDYIPVLNNREIVI